jgi:hypothetical protein
MRPNHDSWKISDRRCGGNIQSLCKKARPACPSPVWTITNFVVVKVDNNGVKSFTFDNYKDALVKYNAWRGSLSRIYTKIGHVKSQGSGST